MCKSASTVSRPSLIRDLSHTFALLRVEKQSWGDKFVIWEEFMRPWNRKIGKTGYQKKTLQRPLYGGRSPPPPHYESDTVWGSAVSSPSGVWGEAPAANDFGAFSGPRNATDCTKNVLLQLHYD